MEQVKMIRDMTFREACAAIVFDLEYIAKAIKEVAYRDQIDLALALDRDTYKNLELALRHAEDASMRMSRASRLRGGGKETEDQV